MDLWMFSAAGDGGHTLTQRSVTLVLTVLQCIVACCTSISSFYFRFLFQFFFRSRAYVIFFEFHQMFQTNRGCHLKKFISYSCAFNWSIYFLHFASFYISFAIAYFNLCIIRFLISDIVLLFVVTFAVVLIWLGTSIKRNWSLQWRRRSVTRIVRRVTWWKRSKRMYKLGRCCGSVKRKKEYHGMSKSTTYVTTIKW